MLRTNQRHTNALHGNLVEEEEGRITAYFEEFPDIVAEGENEEEAKENLLIALSEVFEYWKKRGKENADAAEMYSKKPVKRFEVAFG
jgi:predicted RNase H-like HicB family nuclease